MTATCSAGTMGIDATITDAIAAFALVTLDVITVVAVDSSNLPVTGIAAFFGAVQVTGTDIIAICSRPDVVDTDQFRVQMVKLVAVAEDAANQAVARANGGDRVRTIDQLAVIVTVLKRGKKNYF